MVVEETFTEEYKIIEMKGYRRFNFSTSSGEKEPFNNNLIKSDERRLEKEVILFRII